MADEEDATLTHDMSTLRLINNTSIKKKSTTKSFKQRTVLHEFTEIILDKYVVYIMNLLYCVVLVASSMICT